MPRLFRHYLNKCLLGLRPDKNVCQCKWSHQPTIDRSLALGLTSSIVRPTHVKRGCLTNISHLLPLRSSDRSVHVHVSFYIYLSGGGAKSRPPLQVHLVDDPKIHHTFFVGWCLDNDELMQTKLSENIKLWNQVFVYYALPYQLYIFGSYSLKSWPYRGVEIVALAIHISSTLWDFLKCLFR